MKTREDLFHINLHEFKTPKFKTSDQAVVESHLRTSTEKATREYVSRVPIDMRSTRSLSSKRNAMNARTRVQTGWGERDEKPLELSKLRKLIKKGVIWFPMWEPKKEKQTKQKGSEFC